MYSWVLGSQGLRDSLVFLKDFLGESDLNSAISPCLQDLKGWTRKERTRDENIRIDDDPHFAPRPSLMAATISDRFIPA
jgi:hypothetical protein